MRVVDFWEFCSLPDGTVFSYWTPCIADGLYRRGKVIHSLEDETHPIDYWESSLIADSYNGDDPEVHLIEGRWGVYDYSQLYAVYDKPDIDVIVTGLGMDLRQRTKH